MHNQVRVHLGAEVYEIGIKKQISHYCWFKGLCWGFCLYHACCHFQFLHSAPSLSWLFSRLVSVKSTWNVIIKINKNKAKKKQERKTTERGQKETKNKRWEQQGDESSAKVCICEDTVFRLVVGGFGRSSFSPLVQEDIWRAGVTACCSRKLRHLKSIGNYSLYRSKKSSTLSCLQAG